MCTPNCFKWAALNIKEEEIKGKRVIEVGSYDVNGSLRSIVESFRPKEYLGTDIIKGPGVDMICPADKLIERFDKSSFDVVISTCALEHIKDWKSSIINMKDICKRGGLILLIVPSCWPYHGYPHDFWRFSKQDIEEVFSDCEILTLSEDHQKPALVYAKIKKTADFSERDLGDYELYSVVTNKRAKEIRYSDLNTIYFKQLVIKSRIKNAVLNLASRLLSIIRNDKK